jgi:hypothetical protein
MLGVVSSMSMVLGVWSGIKGNVFAWIWLPVVGAATSYMGRKNSILLNEQLSPNFVENVYGQNNLYRTANSVLKCTRCSTRRAIGGVDYVLQEQPRDCVNSRFRGVFY